MKRELRLTADGSPTLYVPELDETYHSMHGSVQEARHVFIENGLRFVATESKQVNILEVGFGTGLNALLTALYAKENAIHINYVGLEAYPVEEAIWKEINYHTDAEARSLYTKIMAPPFGETISIELNFSLFKEAKLIQDWVANGPFDLIYYDAFGPRAQAEMWDLPIFEKLYSLLNVGGALVTYCAQGQFKRHLKSLGMRVENLPGPPGKREMTRGTKI
ncbi:MAG: tRNA (5-methylaminomethyl-2-thiouridine)(34)-methyltransferase MnmD [Flavobacteriia bacterium]|jgi:tRNA U34 5-methylaminomethyl-2-thiouridine-forming methyltransferase MnmC